MADGAAPGTGEQPKVVTKAHERALELFNALWSDSDVGSALRQKAKQKFPDIEIPEDNINPIVEPLKKQIKDLQETIAKDAKERQDQIDKAKDDRLKSDVEGAINAARKTYRLSDEGFEKMIARMKETSSMDAEAAAAWVVSKMPPPPSPGPSWLPQKAAVPGAGPTTDEKRKFLLSDPIGYQDAELAEFARDPDKYVRETFGEAA